MSLATHNALDRTQAALVVVDIQERLAAAMGARERVIARTALLVRAAAIVGIPVIATRQYPKGLGPMEPDVEAVLAEADSSVGVTRIDKLSFDCFADEEFANVVAELGRRQLVLCGMESHICICQTALAGLRSGHEIHVAADACCSRERELHDIAIMRLSAAGVVVT
ncbi:MAG: isochorismatase family protein, partial [Actinobacteria bacterium]